MFDCIDISIELVETANISMVSRNRDTDESSGNFKPICMVKYPFNLPRKQTGRKESLKLSSGLRLCSDLMTTCQGCRWAILCEIFSEKLLMAPHDVAFSSKDLLPSRTREVGVSVSKTPTYSTALVVSWSSLKLLYGRLDGVVLSGVVLAQQDWPHKELVKILIVVNGYLLTNLRLKCSVRSLKKSVSITIVWRIALMVSLRVLLGKSGSLILIERVVKAVLIKRISIKSCSGELLAVLKWLKVAGLAGLELGITKSFASGLFLFFSSGGVCEALVIHCYMCY